MPPVSEKQARAMFAAANGKSTLGIPKSVGQEFVGEVKPKGHHDHHATAEHHHKAIGEALKRKDHATAAKHTGHLLLALRNAKRSSADAANTQLADGTDAGTGPDTGNAAAAAMMMTRSGSVVPRWIAV